MKQKLKDEIAAASKRLKPCPFCGAPGMIYQDFGLLPFNDWLMVECTRCRGGIRRQFGTPETAADQWNLRSTAPAVQKPVPEPRRMATVTYHGGPSDKLVEVHYGTLTYGAGFVEHMSIVSPYPYLDESGVYEVTKVESKLDANGFDEISTVTAEFKYTFKK